MIILIQIISLVFISIILINLLIKFPISIAFPSKRGMHNTSIPSSGGLAILGSYVCVTSYAYLIHDHSLSMSSPIFSLILISLLGYADDKFKGRPWCKEGDYICYGKHSGTKFFYKGIQLLLIFDDDVKMVVEDSKDLDPTYNLSN